MANSVLPTKILSVLPAQDERPMRASEIFTRLGVGCPLLRNAPPYLERLPGLAIAK
jgi:hypothetical protein